MKRIVNAGLSAVAAAMMALMMTACASKEKEAITIDLSEIGNFAEQASFSGEANEGIAVLADNMTVDEWADSEEAVTFVRTFNNVYAEQGITMELEAENGTLSMILVYSEKALGADTAELTDEQREEVHESMQLQYDKFKEQLISSANVLKEEVDASGIHIVYKASDGTELFSQDL